MMDRIDRQIVVLLQDNARTSNAQIARRVGMAPSAVFERIRKLEERGVVQGYHARIDPHALDVALVAYVFVRTEERLGGLDTATRLAEFPEVQEVHNIAGEDCFLVKVRAADTEALGRLLRERFGSIDTIRSTRTTIVLETLKETAKLPVEAGEMEAVHA